MDAPGVDIGSLLKEERLKLGYTLKDAAERTCIRKVYLEHIEDNNFSALPGAAYVRGFVDVYSRFLGLNSKQLLESLPEEISSAKSHTGTAPIPEKFDKQFTSQPGRKGRGMLVSILAIMLLSGMVFYLMKDPAGTDLADDAQVSNKLSQADIVPSEKTAESKQVDDTSDAGIEVAMAKAEVVTTDAVTATVMQPAKEPLPVIPGVGASLRMLAIDEGSLIINLDKRKPHQYPLHDGLDLTWKIKREVGIELSRAGVARFWLDGQEIDIAGLDNFELMPPPEE